MKGPTRSPGIRRAIDRAGRLGFSVQFCDLVTSSALPMVTPPAGLCDHERKTIKVGTRDLTRKGAPAHSREVLLAILEHELEHAEGAEHATDRPDLGLACGGTVRGVSMMADASSFPTFHPTCPTCGWRKGGVDSWDGKRCKCGHWEPPIVFDTQTAHPSELNQPPTLKCQHCRDVFGRPFEEFFHRDRNGPFGWRKWCKACVSEAPSMRARAKAGRAAGGAT